MVSTNNGCILFLKKIQTIKKPGKFRSDGNLMGFNPAILIHEKQALSEHRKHLPIY
jgi:hypothetical protein